MTEPAVRDLGDHEDAVRNEDWLKGTWDLGFDDLGSLLHHVRLSYGVTDDAELPDAVRQFTRLPVWNAAPDKLRGEVHAWQHPDAA